MRGNVINPEQVYDLEVYRNYFLVVFLNADTGEWMYYEKFNDVESWPLVCPQGVYVGFNSKNYDHPVLDAAMDGMSNDMLKALSDEIIVHRKMWWQHNNLREIDQIDLIEVLPGKASLKIYGARNKSKKLMDLPIDPSATITAEQVPLMRYYCLNDCIVTLGLRNTLKPQIDLRIAMSEKYGIDLRSKSDAQIAEAVIVSEYEKLTGNTVYKPKPDALVGRAYRYAPPMYLYFQQPYLQELLQIVLETDFVVGEKGGITLPDSLDENIKLLNTNHDITVSKKLGPNVIDVEGTQYKLGIGGIHSVDKPASFYASENMILEDIDVESYYPKIIINNGFTPGQMADGFREIYERLVSERLRAKHQCGVLKKKLEDILADIQRVSGQLVVEEAIRDGNKTTINGSFGKFGSKYSKLYSPNLLIQTTLTGQLSLLMLIEYFGSRVISANTDGILLYYPKAEKQWVREVVKWWEDITKYRMEYTPYVSYHRRDVNNYLAVTEKLYKGKGCFAKTTLNKNPANEIIYMAVRDKFVNGTDIETFIRNHTDVADFTTSRAVRGGAQKNGIQYGKSVRFYWSNRETTAIYYKASGNTVPTTERSAMMMDLTDELPDDLDYDRYIAAALKLYEEIK